MTPVSPEVQTLTKEEREQIVTNLNDQPASWRHTEEEQIVLRYEATLKELESRSGAGGTGPTDAMRLDFLAAAGLNPSRCVELSFQPKVGMMPTAQWRLHFNGVGVVARSESLREAIDSALHQQEGK